MLRGNSQGDKRFNKHRRGRFGPSAFAVRRDDNLNTVSQSEPLEMAVDPQVRIARCNPNGDALRCGLVKKRLNPWHRLLHPNQLQLALP